MLLLYFSGLTILQILRNIVFFAENSCSVFSSKKFIFSAMLGIIGKCFCLHGGFIIFFHLASQIPVICRSSVNLETVLRGGPHITSNEEQQRKYTSHSNTELAIQNSSVQLILIVEITHTFLCFKKIKITLNGLVNAPHGFEGFWVDLMYKEIPDWSLLIHYSKQ